MFQRQLECLEIPFIEAFPDPKTAAKFDFLVDALFGFSFRPPIREPFGQILKQMESIQTQVPIVSIDIPSGMQSNPMNGLVNNPTAPTGWDVEKGPPEENSGLPILSPLALISLTAPKQCAQYFKGEYHFLGGRFVPPA